MTVDIISTNRLLLRSTCDSDFGTLYDIAFSDPEVMCHAFEGKPLSKKESTDFFTNSFDHDGNGKQIGVLVLKNADIPIGFAGLWACSVLGKLDYEIGFVLGQEFWGKGYATEIGLAQIDYGLDTIGCNRLLALVSPKNIPSISVLHNIGMVYHATAETEKRGIKEIYIAQRHT